MEGGKKPKRPGILHSVWQTTKPYHKVIAFLGGFLWDAARLTRIDRLYDNVRLASYLLLLAGLLVYSGRNQTGRDSSKSSAYAELGSRFFFGGLFSAYVVLYFKSASVGPSMVFLGLLAALFLGNEFMEDLFRGMGVQLVLYFFCTFSFLLFAVPVFLGIFGTWDFILSGAMAFAWTWTIASLATPRTRELNKTYVFTWAGMFAFLASMHALNVIPPVPLSVMYAGVYHDVKRTEAGYELTYGEQPWQALFSEYDETFDYRPGDKACCFSAVFAPKGSKVNIKHAWQVRTKDGWSTTDEIGLKIVGGRGSGYRSYSCKKKIVPGEWRVSIQDMEARELGTVEFKVIESDAVGTARNWRKTYY